MRLAPPPSGRFVTPPAAPSRVRPRRARKTLEAAGPAWAIRVATLAGAVLLCANGLPGSARSGGAAVAGEMVVETIDGRSIRGRVSKQGAAILVQDGVRDTYLTPAVVSGQRPAPPRPAEADAPGAPLEYVFNEELVSGKKKGTLGLVVDNWRWGAVDRRAGTIAATMHDFKLGDLSVTLAVHRVTPRNLHLKAVEYEADYAFPYKRMGHMALPLIREAIDLDDPASLRKACRFFLEAGDLRAIEQLLQYVVDPPAEIERMIAAARLRQEIDAIQVLTLSGRRVEATERALALDPPESVAMHEPELAGRCEALKRRAALQRKLLERIQQALAEHGVAMPAPSMEQALRLRTIYLVGGEPPDWKLAPWLAQRWGDEARGLTPTAIQEAVDLAQLTAAYFGQEESNRPLALGKMYEESTLPLKLRRAIFAFARSFPPLETPPPWQAVPHGPRGKGYHYFIQLPGNYRPDTPAPVLVALHGQTSTAEAMKRFWGETADRFGFVLISPEYIYGRRWGYNSSTEESEAILGAVRHATRTYNLDMDRVCLLGHSQGGHAAWDLGSAHAGQWAGVVPIIGAAQLRRYHENFLDTSLYAIDGSLDGGAPKLNRESIQDLARMGAKATYVEFVGRKHEAFYEEHPIAAAWMLRQRRDPGRRSIHLLAIRDNERRRNWIQVTKPEKALPERSFYGKRHAKVFATVEEEKVTIEARYVKGIEILLEASLFADVERLRIQVNRRYIKKSIQPDWTYALKSSFERRDRQEIFLGAVRIPVR